MKEPICPNHELSRLRSILEEGTPEHIGKHTLIAVAFVPERLQEAHSAGVDSLRYATPQEWERRLGRKPCCAQKSLTRLIKRSWRARTSYLP